MLGLRVTLHMVAGLALQQTFPNVPNLDWLLPREVFAAIRYHHDAAAVEGRNPCLPLMESRHLIALAQVAEQLIHVCTGMDHTEEWTKLGSACLQTLGIDDDEMQQLQEACREAVNSDE